MTSDLLLPAGTRLVHIGPHKTGSTAIQNALFSIKDQLGQYDVAYPARAQRARKASQALRAVISDADDEEVSDDKRLEPWEKFVAHVEAADAARVCISDEDFAKCVKAVPRIVADLGGEKVHVVAVARSYQAYLPSQWQQRVRAGLPDSYEDWLRIVFGDGHHFEKRNVWRSHDTEALVARWLEHVDPDRFTLIVADESDRTQLPRVFEQLLGLPDGLLAPDPTRSNESLSFAEVELVRAVNRRLMDNGWSRSQFQDVVVPGTQVLKRREGLDRAPGPSKPTMPDWAFERMEERSRARVEAIKRLPVHVVGDPDHLLPRPQSTTADDGVPALPVDFSAAMVAGVVTQVLEERRREQRRRRQRAQRSSQSGPDASADDSGTATDLARRAARGVRRRLGR